ncbi:MAG: DUF3604 domain-containing protein, partial [Pseudomonadales bacterium]
MSRSLAIVLLCLLPLSSWGEDMQLLWGDTHVHTSYSPDSYLSQNFSADPDTAFRFARGLPVIHPSTRTRVQLDTPLDFLVVADHAESYGVFRRANEEGLPREGLGPIDWLKSWFAEAALSYMAGDPNSISFLLKFATDATDDVVESAKTPPSLPIPNAELVRAQTWRDSTNAADEHNTPGSFTTLIGWEWSSIPAGANLHRVIFTDSDAATAQQYIPYASSSSNYPEDLWQWLDQTATRTGADFVAIPHNSNISRGFMFPSERRLRGTAIDAEWIALRARWELAVEITQVKGDSETDIQLSPNDPFAEFEAFPYYLKPGIPAYSVSEGDFVRAALKTGLKLEQQFGQNPYRLGIIGSTDSHTGLAGAEEPNFWGKMATDSLPKDKSRSSGTIDKLGWAMSASGLAGVWAEENTREAIFKAFQRREIYGTTGPLIRVSVYAGTNFKPDDDKTLDHKAAREMGVPMGGELSNLSQAPSFLINAGKDPKSAHLDRLQVIKGWRDGDKTYEKVYDAAWSGSRVIDPDGNLPMLPDTVNSTTGTYSNEYGSPTLSTVWTDPDFDPLQSAFYYVRVIEVATPRHSTLDAIALQIDPAETGQAISLQERAYTSPIYYSPT